MRYIFQIMRYIGLAIGILAAGISIGAIITQAAQSAEPLTPYALTSNSAPNHTIKAQEVEPLPTVKVPLRSDAYSRRLEAVEAYLNNIKTMTARFIQQAPNGAMNRGTLKMQRPGHVRFEYSDDNPVLIVADGKTLNLIDYDMNEITKWPVMDTPLAFLLKDKIKLDDTVELSFSGNEAIANMISVTARDPKKPEQGSLTLIFESRYKENSDIELEVTLRAWQVIDAQGGLTTVSLSDVEINTQISAETWTFKDPRGERATRRRRVR